MPPAADVDLLEVRLHGEPIGTLTRLGDDRVAFAFGRDYIDDPGRHTLSLAFKDNLGGLLTDHPPTRPRLLPYFSNLLPEGALRDYLARRAGVKSQREFFLLWALGDDSAGGGDRPPRDGPTPAAARYGTGRPIRRQAARRPAVPVLARRRAVEILRRRRDGRRTHDPRPRGSGVPGLSSCLRRPSTGFPRTNRR